MKELQGYQADSARLDSTDTVVLGISTDSPAANAAFAKQIGVTFPLLSEMNRKVLTAYVILKTHNIAGDDYGWAERTTFVLDKRGVIQHIVQGGEAIDTNSAVSVCTLLKSQEKP